MQLFIVATEVQPGDFIKRTLAFYWLEWLLGDGGPAEKFASTNLFCAERKFAHEENREYLKESRYFESKKMKFSLLKTENNPLLTSGSKIPP